MNVLVTGSNGFIGSHVAKYLKEKGFGVCGLGRSAYPSIEEVVDDYIQCDLATGDAKQILTKVGKVIDVVVHLAADMRKEPHCVEVIKANCSGTQSLLEMCEESGIKVFMQLSSLPVIGHPEVHPITESHPLNPYTVYHITKVTEEMLANYACKYHGIRTASFRISAPIGPRMNPNTIFPTFVRNAVANKDIVLMGKGLRKQNYLAVNDIARCIELSIKTPTVQGVYNLTSNLLISNKDLAKKTIEVLNSKSKIVFLGEDSLDGDVWDASIEKIHRDGGYMPKANIEKMIREYADWYVNNFLSIKSVQQE